jgi:hypothetical protein
VLDLIRELYFGKLKAPDAYADEPAEAVTPARAAPATNSRPMGDLLGRRYRRTPPLREELARPQRTIKRKENTHSFPLSTYSAPGGLRQDPGRAA